MLTLPRFRWIAPATLAEALALKAEHGAKALLVAGGTDAVPNLKHRLHEPEVIVSLARVPDLRGVTHDDAGSAYGALETLAAIAGDAGTRQSLPALARAASLVASPQIRNMGTLGGNLCLDTRCTYYNQTYFWRQALGFCLKKDGTRCHVVPQGKRCVAAHSSDVAPALIALGAQVEIASVRERRTLAVDEFFVGDGVHNNVLAPDEVVVRVVVPAAARGVPQAYDKLRPRGAIDFPMLSVAFAARGADVLEGATLVVGALGARPRVVGRLDEIVRGQRPSEALIEAVAAAAHRQCTPLTNVPFDADWRHAMVPVWVKRVMRAAFVKGASS